MLRLGLDASVLGDIEAALQREWIEANGLGGWASSSVVGANTRREHGLLVAALRPPGGRFVLLSKLEESVVVGEARHDLGVNRYPGAIHPQGHRALLRFERDLFPSFVWQVDGAVLRKTVVGVHGENTTVVVYELIEAAAPVTLELSPLIAGRPVESLRRGDPTAGIDARFEDGILACDPVDGGPELRLGAPGATWVPGSDWYWNFEYDRDRERGLDCREDLFRPGTLRWTLAPGERRAIVVTAGGDAGRDGCELADAEAVRRGALLARLGGGDDLAETLALAAESFLARRGAGTTVVAGYPCFTDRGRDALISLVGLTGVTRRFEVAREVLRTFVRHERDGLLPAGFPDDEPPIAYDAADAPLWLFVAVYRHLAACGDRAFVRDEMLPVLRKIVRCYDGGTRHGIGVAPDGLVVLGEPDGRLTWMDAKVGDRAATPRRGKPVEVESLWYNALCVLSQLERAMGSGAAAHAHAIRAREVRRTFLEVFWNPERGCLYDVVGPDGPDGSIRPNQIFAISLPFPLLSLDRARAVLDVVEAELETPFGLRSLSPSDPAYRSRGETGQEPRDGARHQGMVWSWLLGPYLTAVVRVRGAAGRRRAVEIVERFREHLVEAGAGTVSEFFEGDPPHAPRGCYSQAWAVAEVLRAWVEDVGPSADRTVLAARGEAGSVAAPYRPAVSVAAPRKRPYKLIDPSADRPQRPRRS